MENISFPSSLSVSKWGSGTYSEVFRVLLAVFRENWSKTSGNEGFSDTQYLGTQIPNVPYSSLRMISLPDTNVIFAPTIVHRSGWCST